jgi:hypothetical protein
MPITSHNLSFSLYFMLLSTYSKPFCFSSSFFFTRLSLSLESHKNCHLHPNSVSGCRVMNEPIKDLHLHLISGTWKTLFFAYSYFHLVIKIPSTLFLQKLFHYSFRDEMVQITALHAPLSCMLSRNNRGNNAKRIDSPPF